MRNANQLSPRKADIDATASLKSFKEVLQGDELTSRAYKKIIEEAVRVIEILQKASALSQASQVMQKSDTPTMSKILQEIRDIKSTISQPQESIKSRAKSWAAVAAKPDIAETTIRIQDEVEKQHVAKLSSEELVRKIGRKEIIGAKNLSNGQVKVYFAEESTKKIMEREKAWTLNIATTAQISSPRFHVLIHDMPYSFEPGNEEHIKELQISNDCRIPGLQIRRATWLKKPLHSTKKSGSLIIAFESPEQADSSISKGIMWKYELKAVEIFRSGFRAIQCFNCQKFGHMAKMCTSIEKCGQCAENHNTRACSKDKEKRCCNCGKKHEAWSQSCPVKIAAKAKAANNRTQDPGRFQYQRHESQTQKEVWQTVMSKKRKSGSPLQRTSRAGSTTAVTRGPGRPRKQLVPGTPFQTPMPFPSMAQEPSRRNTQSTRHESMRSPTPNPYQRSQDDPFLETTRIAGH